MFAGWTCNGVDYPVDTVIDPVDADYPFVAQWDKIPLVRYHSNYGEGDEETVTEITFTLTQKETLKLKPGKAEVQLRAVMGADPETAIASEIATLEVGKILRDGEIHA